MQLVMLGCANSNTGSFPLVKNPSQYASNTPNDNDHNSFNLTEYLIANPADTYYFQVLGNSMIGLGIYDRDILIVDRSLKPNHEDNILMAIKGELICKRLEFINGLPYLIPNHSAHSCLSLNNEDSYVWGVVTHNIHFLKNKLYIN